MVKVPGGWFGRKTAQLVQASALIDNLKSPDPAVRRKVAENPAVSPEMLYLLATDPDPRVRRAVAAHKQTPAQVSPLLAQDQDVDVREVLLQRLVKLLPDLPPAQQGEVYLATVKALETLAHDEVLRIREALANTLKDVAYAPYSVVKTLAEDIEESVARPVLQLCAALTDDDLLEIIGRHAAPWVLPAIARRATLSAAVSGAIIDQAEAAAGGVLLDNRGAVIDEPGLEALVEQAQAVPGWQPKLASRPALPSRLALRMAEYVEETVLKILQKRKDFDAETRAEVASVTRRRLDYLETTKGKQPPEARALALAKQGKLDETALLDAISWNDRAFVMAALGAKLPAPAALVERIFATKSPRAIVALSWKAGFSMRAALRLQGLAGVTGREILNARNGQDYPLTPKDMQWQLELVGVVK
jgi:uncharacterized protein (DUF2336 family)